ncbi:MAG: phosphoribosylglycinamide formyltransferase [candidate division WOR-3 bacterium]|nr:phosphoribosylglycinamide formyltransferase [candidate division WOR-3 bacterium]MCX7947878.1 phosphoribosylglycinamide formyltransferase [candidate division WOR-3 bacterium]MDW8150700.1 phosphoribosylglycinamide formyltransferase [candidate division WOR-3 bacterium]
MKEIIVMGSGYGSNFQAIYEYFKDKPLTIKALISDNPRAYIIERARLLNVRSVVLDYKSMGKEKYNEELLKVLSSLEPFNLIVLAGYMRIIPEFIVKKYWKKIINIHPSLLPAFKGLRAIERAYNYGVKITGITIHWVNEFVDEGEIIEQVCIRIEENDNLETLESKIHELEHYYYPRIIERILFHPK